MAHRAHAALLVLMASAAGCEPAGDAPAPPAPMPDLVMPEPTDLMSIFRPGARTGAACNDDSECAPSRDSQSSHGTCYQEYPNYFQQDGTPITVSLPGGMCRSPCKVMPDGLHGTSSECPSETAACISLFGRGTCWPICQQARDCREPWVCGYVFYGAARATCLPPGFSDCDPPDDPRPLGKRCAPDRVCISFSGDNSVGYCFLPCDPVVQDCPKDGDTARNCVTNLQSPDGSGFCVGAGALREGDACGARIGCNVGMVCHLGHCRYQCRLGGAPGGPLKGLCPSRQTCRAFYAPDQHLLFGPDKTGVCDP